MASYIIGNNASKGDAVRVTVKDGELVVETRKPAKKVKSSIVTRSRKIA